MLGGNPLLGSRANPDITAGYAAGVDDVPSAAKSMLGESDFTNVKVGVIVAAGVLFIVALHRGGFRDVIVT